VFDALLVLSSKSLQNVTT